MYYLILPIIIYLRPCLKITQLRPSCIGIQINMYKIEMKNETLYALYLLRCVLHLFLYSSYLSKSICSMYNFLISNFSCRIKTTDVQNHLIFFVYFKVLWFKNYHKINFFHNYKNTLYCYFSYLEYELIKLN